MNKKSTIKIMAECAMLIALGTILAQIRIIHMPGGGSVTAASMVPFMLIGYRYGTKWGLICALANAALQMVTGGVYMPPAGTFAALAASVLLDYVFAYMSAAFGTAFSDRFGKNLRGLILSSSLMCFLRFLCSFLSGFLVWGSVANDGFSAVIYSLTYNGGYMLPESLITVSVLALLYKKRPDMIYS